MAKDDFRDTLYTIDKRGRRRWVYSALVMGRFFKPRATVAYLLMGFYLLMPWVTIGGHQGIHFDIIQRKFFLFGAEFWATDSYFLFLILGSLAFSLFLFTALFGRVWCGWACPETVFLEFLFRPIERLVEGGPVQRRRLDESPWNFTKIWKKLLKHGLCALFAWVIASSALAYFLGRDVLLQMMVHSPLENPVPFTMTVVMMGLMAFQFGWFREQFCTVICPYARFQSVLMDSNSIVVGYDITRGEPRGKLVHGKPDSEKGDCIACELCVRVCPTGIDIRNGLQLECVACTACIDACDSIMTSIGKQRGLIRYDTEDRLLGRDEFRRILRPRPLVYGAILTVFLGAFVYLLSSRELSEFDVLRGGLDTPFSVLGDGRISNHLTVSISNKGRTPQSYTFTLSGIDGAEIISALNPLIVSPGEVKTAPIFINFPVGELHDGKRRIEIRIRGDSGYKAEKEITILGPDD